MYSRASLTLPLKDYPSGTKYFSCSVKSLQFGWLELKCLPALHQLWELLRLLLLSRSLTSLVKFLPVDFQLSKGTSRRRRWHPTPVLLPGKSHGRRSLVGCSPWSCYESDTTERLHFHFHTLEKKMATHSSVLAWKIPGMEEPGGRPSMESHRIRHDWSDIAAAAAARELLQTFLELPPNPTISLLSFLLHKFHLPWSPHLCFPRDYLGLLEFPFSTP